VQYIPLNPSLTAGCRECTPQCENSQSLEYGYLTCAISSSSFTAVAIPITLLTPLGKEDCNSSLLSSILSTILWAFPGLATADAVLQLQLWYLINRCRAKTDTLLKKLAEGSLEPRGKSRLTGRFSCGLIARLHWHDIRQGSQEGSQQDTTLRSIRGGGDMA
jgi:hypothetical protein